MSAVPSGADDPAAPGWYPDPSRVAPYRWWDGDSWTGEVSSPGGGISPAVPWRDQAEFVGGMDVPFSLGGWFHATIPLVVLTIGELTLRMHLRWFARAMVSDFEVSLHEITAAFEFAGTFSSGVGFELSDGQLAYFGTRRDQGRVLEVLQQRGVRIDPRPRRRTGALRRQLGLLWHWGRSTPSVAKLPDYSRPMRWLVPFINIAVIVIFASKGTAFGWFVAALGAVGLAQSTLFWGRKQ